MTILIDTREQRPLKFSGPSKRVCLSVGDYSAVFGGRHKCDTAFERKSIGDLFGTLSKGYPRFKREIDRAKAQKLQVIILIEGTMQQVANGYFHSRRRGDSVVWQLETIMERHQVAHKYFVNRRAMAKYIEDFFQYKYVEYVKEKGWMKIKRKGAGYYAKN